MLYGQALTFPAGPTVGPNQVFVSTSWLYANKMDYRGAWNAGVVYNSEDAVVSAGSTYVSLQALNLGENPATSPSYWAAIGGGGGGGGGANSLGYYFMAQATNAPANGLNLGALSTGLLKITVSGGTAAPSMAVPGVDYEPGAGNPSTNGYCWTSTTAGVRSWAACGSGSMVYPGAGLPISTGSAWGTSIPRLDALVSIFDPAFGGCGACNAATNAAALTAAMTASRRVYTGLGAGDAGFLWSVTDYAHLLRWTGTGWEFLDAAGNYIAGCAGAPGGSGWQLCDGSATSYLQVAAGIASAVAFTTPNLATTAAYLKFGAGYSASIAAATVPTAGGASATAAVASGSGATPASGAHVHTIALPADPVANLQVVAYYRR